MTATTQRFLFVLFLLACFLTPLIASAGSITYTESFMASGTVNGSPFDAMVSLSLTSDTNQIISNCDGISGIFCTPATMATISIQGIGVGTLTDLFDVFVNQGISVAGFTDQAIEDVVDLSNPAFGTYDLKSPIGPLNGTYFFTDNGVLLGSSLGNVVLDSFSGTPTFEATQGGTTPEPGSLILFVSGILGVAATVRRKMRL